MGTLKVGIREFREKLASYLLENEQAVAITRHGDTVGYYIPARRKREEAERAALKEAASRLQGALAAEGISEEEILRDFKRWRRGDRQMSGHKGLVLDANILLRAVFGCEFARAWKLMRIRRHSIHRTFVSRMRANTFL